ncbi:hypothetical protein [Lacticaseibacillus mingshuiensis]|nr:hypothetical protein [Lacticaseibacillus mingshuiensis]
MNRPVSRIVAMVEELENEYGSMNLDPAKALGLKGGQEQRGAETA